MNRKCERTGVGGGRDETWKKSKHHFGKRTDQSGGLQVYSPPTLPPETHPTVSGLHERHRFWTAIFFLTQEGYNSTAR